MGHILLYTHYDFDGLYRCENTGLSPLIGEAAASWQGTEWLLFTLDGALGQAKEMTLPKHRLWTNEIRVP